MSNTIKKLILCILSVILLFFGTIAVFAASSKSYVGNKSTKVYHISECTYAGKISSQNRVYFSSRSEAESRGYRRCHYCGDDVVEPGHGGNGGSGNSSHSTTATIPKQETVGNPTEEHTESKTVWQIIGETIGILIAILLSPITWLIIELILGFIDKVVSVVKEKQKKKERQ